MKNWLWNAGLNRKFVEIGLRRFLNVRLMVLQKSSKIPQWNINIFETSALWKYRYSLKFASKSLMFHQGCIDGDLLNRPISYNNIIESSMLPMWSRLGKNLIKKIRSLWLEEKTWNKKHFAIVNLKTSKPELEIWKLLMKNVSSQYSPT